MARNRKPEYMKKLLKATTPNGYRFDIANYLHNPSLDHEYPSFIKQIAEDEEKTTFRSVHYFKCWNGSGYYVEQVFDRMKADKDAWVIVKNLRETKLEDSNRFNLTKLLSFC